MTKSLKRGMARHYEYMERLKAVIGMLEQAPPESQNPVLTAFLKIVLASDEKTAECVEQGKPFVSSWYGNAPEIYTSMGIHFINPVFNILVHMNMTQLYDLEHADKMPLADDICSLIRLSYYAVENALLPTPTAILSMMEPCDAEKALHESYKHGAWRDVPGFTLDPSYGATDEDFRYFAGELKRMTAFLVQVTGCKYDIDKLREVVEETNKQYALWSEYNQLRRAIPCPHGSFQGSALLWPLTQHIPSGTPQATGLIGAMVADAEQKVKAGIGAVPNEKIRIYWADLAPTWAEELGAWLAEEWNANVVMDHQGYDPYTRVDTSTEETMLYGLARRALHEVPMIRQGRGTVETLIEDATNIIKDYNINCVIFPGHMGHKDQSASVSFLREVCRELKVPLLTFTSSLFDQRYTPMDKLKQQISEFFTVTGLGKK